MKVFCVALVSLLIPVASFAQDAPHAPPDAPLRAEMLMSPRAPEPPKPPRPPDAMEGKLFPPEVVMHFQGEIDLTSAQKKKLREEVKAAQTEILDLQFAVQDAADELADLMDHTKVDEDKALAQAQKVMDLERKVKTRHLVLLIHVKNLLSESQQKKLKDLVHQ